MEITSPHDNLNIIRAISSLWRVRTTPTLLPPNGSAMATSRTATDINLIARFLAHEQIQDLSQVPPTDCIVLCGSAILHCAETVFSALEKNPNLARTLVICGGIGHSTKYLYRAVAQNPRYAVLLSEIQDLPESRVLNTIFERFYDAAHIARAGCTIIIEDQSTNCGANAIETRRILEAESIPTPKSFIIVQDPTMSIRTLAAFRKTYEGTSPPPGFMACPTFVPEVGMLEGKLEYVTAGGVDGAGLWELGRFCDLVVGEIPRLRDDLRGYGPKGRGFIDHVEIPGGVEEAWRRLESGMAEGGVRLAN